MKPQTTYWTSNVVTVYTAVFSTENCHHKNNDVAKAVGSHMTTPSDL